MLMRLLLARKKTVKVVRTIEMVSMLTMMVVKMTEMVGMFTVMVVRMTEMVRCSQ